MELVWLSKALDDYLYWQQTDNKALQRVNDLIKECLGIPFKGIGKLEPLKGNFAENWSRRITDEHRLIYCIRENRLHILQCRNHYS